MVLLSGGQGITGQRKKCDMVCNTIPNIMEAMRGRGNLTAFGKADFRNIAQKKKLGMLR